MIFILVTSNISSGLGERGDVGGNTWIWWKPHCCHHQIQTITASTNPHSYCKHEGSSPVLLLATPGHCHPAHGCTQMWRHLIQHTDNSLEVEHMSTCALPGQMYSIQSSGAGPSQRKPPGQHWFPDKPDFDIKDNVECRLTCECWVMYLDQFLRLLVYVGDKKLKKKKTRECQMCNLLFNLKKML